jgi:DNA-binding transcriptional ArsR family regulator
MTDMPDWFDPGHDQLLTPKTLRGLVHPIRLRLLDLLQADGPATATGLAKRIDESSGVTSYHLRVLAEHGFVVEDTELGTGRDRWWRAVHRSTSFTFRAPEGPGTDEAMEEAERFIRLVADESYRRAVSFIATITSRRDVLAAMPWTVSQWPLMLTAEEARELRDTVSEMIAKFQRDPARPDTRTDAVRSYATFQLIPDET